jgi:CubicO group peptidase (beta-lactamase class C family)
MSFRLILASVALSFLLASSANAQTQLDDLLEPIRVKYGLPALAAAVAKDGRVIAIGAVGTRVLGAEMPVAVNDRFHIGSDTGR